MSDQQPPDIEDVNGSHREQFARALKQLLAEGKLNQTQLVHRLRRAGFNVSKPRVSEWVNGHNVPREEELVRAIARIGRDAGATIDEDGFWELQQTALDERRRRAKHLAPTQSAAPSTANRSRITRGRVAAVAGVLAVVGIVVALYLQPSASPQRPSPSSIPEASRTGTVYSVSADQSQGAHVHEIPPGSSVEQQFQATLPKILRVAVVIGRPGRPDRDPIGAVRFELQGCTTVPINSTVQAVNNVETLVEFSSPLQVHTGKTCALHITNSSQAVLGFYFNQDSNPQHRTILHGATDPPGDSTPHDHALSGHVLGQLP